MFWRPGSRATRSCGHLSHCCESILAEIYVTDRQRFCKDLYHPSTVPVRRNTNVMPKAGYYAVKVGKRPGIYTTWSNFTSSFLGALLLIIVTREDCQEQVDGYPCAKYKKLRTVEEAEAWILGSASQSGPVEQRGVPYPVRSKTKPANSSLDRASAIIWSQSSEQVRVSSSPSTIKPTPTIQSDSRFQPAFGPSNDRPRAAAEPSRVTASSLSVLAEDVVYTDGACSGNGQYGSVAGIGVWWGPYDTRYALSP